MGKTLKELREELNNAIKPLIEKIHATVKDAGGFIDTRNIDGKADTIYVFVWDFASEEYREYQMMGIRADEKGNLTIAYDVIPMYFNRAFYLKENTFDYFNHESLHGGHFLLLQSVDAIAESLEQYVDKK